MNLMENDDIEVSSELAAIELDSIGNDVLDSGFILDVKETQVRLPIDRVININKLDFTFKEATLSAMIGLYVLKEVYTSIEVIVYGTSYTFEVRNNAVPNKADFVAVHRAVTKGISNACGNNADVNKTLDEILLEIQQDKWKFEE